MSANSGGSLATVLMSVPLAAIPLMAIFGIPQFTQVEASPDELDPDQLLAPGEEAAPAAYRERSADVLSDVSVESAGPHFEPLENPFDSTPLADYDAEHELSVPLDSLARTGSADPSDPRPGDSPAGGHAVFASDPPADAAPAAPPTDSRITWREATRRLRELGIHDYHLESGESHESFLFVCAFAPVERADVTMRFEAEAPEPLLAVADVLDQVDRWLRGRFAQSRDEVLSPEGRTE